MKRTTTHASALAIGAAFATLAAGCGAAPSLYGSDGGSGLADLSVGPGDLGPDPCATQPGYPMVAYLSADAQHTFASADPVLTAGKDYRAVLVTDVGTIVLDLLETDTPMTVNSFVFLALHHYFDGIGFHRVLANFMAQTGDPNTIDQDPSTWGSGGPGYGYGLEIVPSLKYDGAGVVGMARTNDPNSNGSQFFITFSAQHSLDGQYTVFGKVTSGLPVLGKIMKRDPQASPGPEMTRMERVCIVAK